MWTGTPPGVRWHRPAEWLVRLPGGAVSFAAVVGVDSKVSGYYDQGSGGRAARVRDYRLARYKDGGSY